MKRNFWTALAVLGLALGAQAKTIKELNDTFSAGDYGTVIIEADKTLTDPAITLSADDTYGLMMLKAEALLRQGSATASSREFTAAARMASDVQQLAWARASALIARRSNAKTFTPRTGDKEPIDILNPDSRKKAFAALLRDTLPEAQRRHQAAMRATALQSLEDAVVPVADCAFLELAATGSSKEAGDLLKSLGEQTRKLISEDVLRIQRQVSQMDRVANSYDIYGGANRGITTRQKDELRSLLGYLDRVLERVRSYRQASVRVAGDTKDWDSLELQLVALQTDVQAILNTTY